MNLVSIIFVSLFILSAMLAGILWVQLRSSLSKVKLVSAVKKNYENIIRQANDALLVIDIVNGRIYTANPKLCELLGYAHEKLLSLTIFDLHPKEYLERSAEVIADVWEKRGLIYSDIPLVTAAGETLPVECSAKVIPFDSKPAILIYARDIRERLRMEKEISDKNEIIRQKNKDITDSINYAQRIQQAILGDVEEIKKHFPQSFILFKPKDIVSGDFYWFTQRDGGTFIAVADCTGHGVPGGFMSMIGNSFLNEVVNEKNILRPDLILNELREKIIISLRQKGEALENKDGMDIALCTIKNNSLLFSGANNPLWMVHKKELREIPADRQPIGFHPNSKPFTLHRLPLEPGDCIYLFSDGFADQFGGPKRKKFMYRNFANLILSMHAETMNIQQKILDRTLENWKGEIEQVDDILVIGIRI